MAEIIKVYREHLPASRLVGRRYGNSDRDAAGTYGSKWGEWFAQNRFAPLEAAGGLPENGDAYVGMMRMPDGTMDSFEYWIGMLLPPDTAVSEGYESIEISAADIGVCWIYGTEADPALYGMEEACARELRAKGWAVRPDAWHMERYNCPRFTTPDESGKVILDMAIFLQE